MPKKKDPNALTPNQKAFCLAYIAHDRNGTLAYMSIHPRVTEATAASAASALIRIPKVKAEIDRLIAEAFKAEHMTPEEVIAELSRIGRSDLADALDENGTLLPMRDMPKATRRAIQSIKVERTQFGMKREIKLWDKTAALRTLGQHHGIISERHDHTHTMKLEDLLGGVDDEEGKK